MFNLKLKVMPKQESFIELKGTMGKVTLQNGRGIHGPSQGQHEPRAYVLTTGMGRIRENLSRWRGRFCGEGIPHGAEVADQEPGDSRVTARVTGVMRKINRAELAEGQRSFEMLPEQAVSGTVGIEPLPLLGLGVLARVRGAHGRCEPQRADVGGARFPHRTRFGGARRGDAFPVGVGEYGAERLHLRCAGWRLCARGA